VKWAEAMGCVAIRVESPEEVEPAIEKANSINDRTVVVEFRTDSDEKVFPMVPAGMGNDDSSSTRPSSRSATELA
jgi:acetolactate synthase I/II/III large subunit